MRPMRCFPIRLSLPPGNRSLKLPPVAGVRRTIQIGMKIQMI